MKKQKSLGGKVRRLMIISMVLIIILISACAYATTITNYQSEHEHTIAASIAACRNNVDKWLNQKVAVAQFMAYQAGGMNLNDDKIAAKQFVKSGDENDNDAFACYIVFSDGSAVFANDWDPGDMDFRGREWYLNASASEGVILTDPYKDIQTGKDVITAACKIQNENGELVGVLGFDIYTTTLSDMVYQLIMDKTGYPVLMTSDGGIVVHKNEEFLVKTDSSGNSTLTDFESTVKNYSGDALGKISDLTDYDGQPSKYYELPLLSIDWKIGYMFKNKEYYAVNMQVSLLFGIITIVSGGLISAVVAFIIKRVFNSLKIVDQEAQEVAKGKLDIKFSYGLDDEIGRLCRTIEKNNSIVKDYIIDINNRLERISNGDFNCMSEIEYIGDYMSIKAAMDNISNSLGTVFGGIDKSSGLVSNGAEGVSASSAQLANSVSKQSTLVGEIVNGVNVVADKIQMNVENTDKAREIALKTTGVVNAGSEQMNKLLAAMNDISVSSEKIKNIISTIEDIAFQTNILSLNASIEAARAGEAGKGFAVVADEVRNLAGKSAEASEETAKLIEHSVNAVVLGKQLADETSNSLNEVVIHSQDIEKIIVSINEESHDQNNQITSVNEKITQIESLINSAASNAEQSAAAADQLNEQATALKAMLEQFEHKKL